jgi:hypothetical protein
MPWRGDDATCRSGTCPAGRLSRLARTRSIRPRQDQPYAGRCRAKRLTAHLEDLLSAHEDLKPASQSAYGTWDAAQQFYSSAQAGHATLVDQHSRVLHALLHMVKKLHRSAQVYDAAEAELERRVAAVDKRLHAVTTTDLLQHGRSTAPPGAAVPNSLNPEGGD